jgi:hypothetical protein
MNRGKSESNNLVDFSETFLNFLEGGTISVYGIKPLGFNTKDLLTFSTYTSVMAFLVVHNANTCLTPNSFLYSSFVYRKHNTKGLGFEPDLRRCE